MASFYAVEINLPIVATRISLDGKGVWDGMEAVPYIHCVGAIFHSRPVVGSSKADCHAPSLDSNEFVESITDNRNDGIKNMVLFSYELSAMSYELRAMSYLFVLQSIHRHQGSSRKRRVEP